MELNDKNGNIDMIKDTNAKESLGINCILLYKKCILLSATLFLGWKKVIVF